MGPSDVIRAEIGDELPPLIFGPISRHTLALYCGGSGDHNPIHVDIDFARQSGFDDVFAHGMLSMAILGRLLTNWVDQKDILSFGVRFSAITHVNDVVTATARIADKVSLESEKRLVLDLAVQSQSGAQTLAGKAIVRAA